MVNLQFEVTNFEMVYNTFLGRPTLSKFMAIPHYAYMVLKMSGPHRVISISGDIKHAYDYHRESCEMTSRLTTSVELQDLKQALVEAKTSKTSIKPEDSLSKIVQLSTEEPFKVAHVCNNLDPK
jgi:hypothetical protein